MFKAKVWGLGVHALTVCCLQNVGGRVPGSGSRFLEVRVQRFGFGFLEAGV